jgi:aldose 1-epimerase
VCAVDSHAGTDEPAVELHTFKGEAAVALRDGDYEATFLPGCGMLCTSLRYRDEEYVAWPQSLARFRAGVITAMPLVHPWGNRLARWGYRAAGKRVDLRNLDLPVDPNGLPIHGNLRGTAFQILRLRPGRLRARLDYGARPDLLAAFPFPHIVEIDARVDGRGLRLRTTVTPTSDRAVPISFCWHPYLRLPDAPRSQWMLQWPRCRHVEVDEHLIPNGATTRQAAECAPIADRTFDDHYVLGKDRGFEVAAAGRRIRLTFDANYDYAQLFVPPRREFIAIEPMTATIDALGQGRAPLCEPGSTFAASFTVTCQRDVNSSATTA